MTTIDKVELERLTSCKNLDIKISQLVKSIQTGQESLHKTVLLPAALHAFKFRDPAPLRNLLNALLKVKGSVRVESIAYWVSHVAGIRATYDEKANQFNLKFAVKKGAEPLYQSDLGIEFTYDKDHAESLRNKTFRYWSIAPVKIQVLKLPEIDKATLSSEKALARALLAGAIDEEQLIAHIAGMVERVKKLSIDSKTKEWVSEYIAQQSPQAPTVTEVTELEAPQAPTVTEVTELEAPQAPTVTEVTDTTEVTEVAELEAA
jgi:hypothetical protein